MKPEKVTELATQFVDCDYALGDTKLGFDCLSMVLDFYGDYPWPDEYKGFTRENYAQIWGNTTDKTELSKEFGDWLLSLGTPIEKNYLINGDLIIMKIKDVYFPGIYLGNDHIIFITEKGGRVMPFSKLIDMGIVNPIAYRRMS